LEKIERFLSTYQAYLGDGAIGERPELVQFLKISEKEAEHLSASLSDEEKKFINKFKLQGEAAEIFVNNPTNCPTIISFANLKVKYDNRKLQIGVIQQLKDYWGSLGLSETLEVICGTD